ncbi:hypothetical protein CEXT_563601, partial [Caerostris extrusa]
MIVATKSFVMEKKKPHLFDDGHLSWCPVMNSENRRIEIDINAEIFTPQWPLGIK